MSVITTARPTIRSGPNRQALVRTAFLWTSRVYAGAIFVQVFLAGSFVTATRRELDAPRHMNIVTVPVR